MGLHYDRGDITFKGFPPRKYRDGSRWQEYVVLSGNYPISVGAIEAIRGLARIDDATPYSKLKSGLFFLVEVGEGNDGLTPTEMDEIAQLIVTHSDADPEEVAPQKRKKR